MQSVAPVAQPDRALDSGSKGWGFDSLRARIFTDKKVLIHVNNLVSTKRQTTMANTAKSQIPDNALGLQADSTEMEPAGIQLADNSQKSGFESFITTNLKAILIGIIVLIAGVVVVMYMRNSQSEGNSQASLQLSRIKSYYESGNWEKALTGDPSKQVRGESVPGLVEITDQFGGSEAGMTAALYAGSVLAQQKKYQEAEDYFEHAAKSKSAVVELGAKAGQALCKEKSNDYAAAAELYAQAASLGKDVGMEDRYRFFAAVNYEKANAKDKAVEMYTILVMKNSVSEFSAEAKNALARLGTIIE